MMLITSSFLFSQSISFNIDSRNCIHESTGSRSLVSIAGGADNGAELQDGAGLQASAELQACTDRKEPAVFSINEDPEEFVGDDNGGNDVDIDVDAESGNGVEDGVSNVVDKEIFSVSPSLSCTNT